MKIGERTTDVWAPAVARLDSDDQVGDAVEANRGRTRGWRGFPVGYTYTNGAPVHFGLHVQVARDRGAGIAIIGASGGGKSTLALLLYFWESESGTQCMVLDPKNDFEKFTYYIAFGEQVMQPGFSADAEAGILGTEDDVQITNELHVPKGEEIVLRIKSQDVLHSFFLPNLRIKQDVVPGMSQHLWFRANKNGIYDIVCAELCGWGHYKMRGRLTVQEPADFQKWLAEQSTSQNQAEFVKPDAAGE